MQLVRYLISAYFIIGVLLSLNLSAEEKNTLYLESLIKASRDLNLSSEPAWLALGHYNKNSISSGYTSFSDGEIFFNAPDGKYNPQGELEATLARFFTKEERVEGEDKQPYPCAFIARYTWLKERLQFDLSQMPEFKCQRYQKWIEALNPKSITLIFPSSYINNPASAFGHTLLRIDQVNQDEKTRLLAYTANYAAATEGEGGFVYAFKGVFGGYSGYFSVAPYYEKVKKYSDMEKRDIWEYELNFTEQEVEFLLKHLWELRSVPFSYYYFDENCSYHLLSLLEVARPSLRLIDSFSNWVIPVDTVRRIIREQGLLRAATFRPSLVTKLEERIASTSQKNRDLAKKLAEGTISSEDTAFSNEPEGDRVQAIDLAYEYLNFKVISGKDRENQLQQRAYQLLRNRSTLPPSLPVENKVPEIRPDQGHETARLGLASGRQDGKWFYDLRVRPAYHDILDPTDGFYKGAEIEMFDAVARHLEEDSLELERLFIVDIKSLSARNQFLKPTSWNLGFGFEKMYMDNEKRSLAFSLNGGLGHSWNLSEHVFAYGLVDVSNDVSTRLDKGYAIGPGPTLGLIIAPIDAWLINPRVSNRVFLLGDTHSETELALEQTFTIGPSKAVRLLGKRTYSFGEEGSEVMLAIDFYL